MSNDYYYYYYYCSYISCRWVSGVKDFRQSLQIPDNQLELERVVKFW